MPPRSFELREFFHLALLHHLSARLSGRSWAVKGGICLRFFHRSPRLSEDMDLDVVSSLRSATLRDGIDSILNSRPFLSALSTQGITGLEITKPKQTETTQRWKVALLLGGTALPTKVEFSRRHSRLEFVTGVPDPGLLARYRLPVFGAQYFGAETMSAQKIRALAAPARTAVRDLFDLQHLLAHAGARPAAIGSLVHPDEIEAAADKIDSFRLEDFRDQVAPYLEEAVAGVWSNAEGFSRLKKEVSSALLGMAR